MNLIFTLQIERLFPRFMISSVDLELFLVMIQSELFDIDASTFIPNFNCFIGSSLDSGFCNSLMKFIDDVMRFPFIVY